MLFGVWGAPGDSGFRVEGSGIWGFSARSTFTNRHTFSWVELSLARLSLELNLELKLAQDSTPEYLDSNRTQETRTRVREDETLKP